MPSKQIKLTLPEKREARKSVFFNTGNYFRNFKKRILCKLKRERNRGHPNKFEAIKLLTSKKQIFK